FQLFHRLRFFGTVHCGLQILTGVRPGRTRWIRGPQDPGPGPDHPTQGVRKTGAPTLWTGVRGFARLPVPGPYAHHGRP
ncbi:MAG: hypothetical protein ACOYM8_10080, partial [Caulobacterales bacterium]